MRNFPAMFDDTVAGSLNRHCRARVNQGFGFPGVTLEQDEQGKGWTKIHEIPTCVAEKYLF
jgi:hypothetical protein